MTVPVTVSAARDPSSSDEAREAALAYLGHSPRTVREVSDRLREKGFTEDASADAVTWLVSIGYLDDAAFARTWAERRHPAKHASRSRLRQELRRKGVGDDEITEALEPIDEDSERQQAAALIARRLPSTRGLPVATRTQRMLGMLARRGYPTSLALAVIREALAEEGQDAEDLYPDTQDQG